jgi:hypothetical protein
MIARGSQLCYNYDTPKNLFLKYQKHTAQINCVVRCMNTVFGRATRVCSNKLTKEKALTETNTLA